MKREIGDLRLFGGPPAFLHTLYVGEPNTGDRDRFFDRLAWALDNRWLTNGGPLLREFEERVAELAEVRNAVATCNATAGLHLLIHGCGLTGEIIMPALTFVATAHAVRWLGLQPVFCDIDPATGCLHPAQVEAAITPHTTGIIGVHLWGRPCPADELEKIAAGNSLILLFDAAHALGCTYREQRIGGFGAAEVFSFHATKVAHSFEGGAITTNNDELAQRLRAMRNFGLNQDGVVEALGTNAKMSEAAAAMGLTSLDAFSRAVVHNRVNYELYRCELDGVAGVQMISYDEQESNNYHYLVIEVDEGICGLGRDLLREVLRAENVVAQRYFHPGCHQMEPYRSERTVTLPHTERLSARVLALPTGPGVSREDIRRVCDIVRIAVTHGVEVTARWRQS